MNQRINKPKKFTFHAYDNDEIEKDDALNSLCGRNPYRKKNIGDLLQDCPGQWGHFSSIAVLFSVALLSMLTKKAGLLRLATVACMPLTGSVLSWAATLIVPHLSGVSLFS